MPADDVLVGVVEAWVRDPGRLLLQVPGDDDEAVPAEGPLSGRQPATVRPSRLGADPKHGVSEELFTGLGPKLDVRAGDILMVRDGTYMIGTSAMVMPTDTRILYQSHLYKIRVNDSEALDRWLFFAALNTPIVKKQIRSKQFTQDIIDTLGGRILELRIPIPRDRARRETISSRTREILEGRAALREEARRVAAEVAEIGVEVLDEDTPREITGLSPDSL